MSEIGNRVVEICNSRYQEIYGNYNMQSTKKIICSHFGEFSQELVNSITNSIENKLIAIGDKRTRRKLFSILVEGLQNVRLHGEKDDDGNQISFLIVAQDENEYLVTLGNLVDNKNISTIKRKLDNLNSFDEKAIKNLFMNVLTNGIISNKGGAGLGFITMAMKSKNKLNHNFQPINDRLSCFFIELKIDRS